MHVRQSEMRFRAVHRRLASSPTLRRRPSPAPTTHALHTTSSASSSSPTTKQMTKPPASLRSLVASQSQEEARVRSSRWHERWDGPLSLQHKSGERQTTRAEQEASAATRACAHPLRQPHTQAGARLKAAAVRAGANRQGAVDPDAAALRQGGVRSEAEKGQEEDKSRV